MSSNKKVKISIEVANSTDSSSLGIKNIHCTDHAILALEHMRSLKYFSDIVLIAGKDGKRVSSHRLVLSASSPYFSAMFTGSMREADQHEVTLSEVRGDILEALVEYCYSGRLQLRQDTVEMLLVTASMFQINSVVSACTTYLAEQLEPSNCLGMTIFAEQYHCKELQKKAEDCTHQQFTQVCKNDEFFQLDVLQLSKLIASDDLYVKSEEVIFHSVMAWLNADLPAREQHICELMPLVRMTQLSPSFLTDHVEAICRSHNCQDLLMEAFKWHDLPEERREMATKNTRPRNSIETLMAIGVSMVDKTISIECYCPHADKWSIRNTGINYRLSYGVATLDDNLLIVGGQYGRVLNTSFSLNLSTWTLTELKPMHLYRQRLCVAVLENCLYAIGGHDGENSLYSVERWDPVECSWCFVAPMSSMREYAGAVVLNGCIYVVGGCNDAGCISSVECYDPRFDSWVDCASMSVSRSNCGVAVSNGVLYAVGGEIRWGSGTPTAECYDPVANKWTMIEPMSVVREDFGLVAFGNCLMAVGEFETCAVEQYDLETKKWCGKGTLAGCYYQVDACVVPTHYLANLSQ